jgi:hypothetical protein
LRKSTARPRSRRLSVPWACVADVTRASRPLWGGHLARGLFILPERDAPATAGGTPAPQ